jgi:hypothetical protein
LLLEKTLEIKDSKLKVEFFEPKTNKTFRKLYNNLYVKNFPESWDENKL